MTEETIVIDFENFNPEDFPQRVCCGLPEFLITYGFVFPISVVRLEDPDTQPKNGLMMKFFERDARSHKPNLARTIDVYLQYCPFCGGDIGYVRPE